MDDELQGKKIAFLIGQRDVDQEDGLWETVRNAGKAVRRAGGIPHLLYTDSGEVEDLDLLPEDYFKKRNMRVYVNVSASEYFGLVLPVRVVDSDFSGVDQGWPEAESFARQFLKQERPTLVVYLKKRNM